MKTALVLGLTIGLVLAGMHWAEYYQYEQAWNPDNLVRLHVAAHSDEEEDQSVKLEVRDAVLEILGPSLRTMESVTEATNYLYDKLAKLEGQLAAHQAVAGREVEVMLQREWFPHRTYGELALPAGEYYALRVNIGQGVGGNWWCLLFPPLCLVDAAVDYDDKPGPGVGVISEEETTAPPTRVRWAFWEYLQGLRWWSAHAAD